MADFKKTMKDKKQSKAITDEEKVKQANIVKLPKGRPIYFKETRKMINIKMSESDLDRLNEYAKAKYNGNKTTAINDIVVNFLTEQGF